MVRQLISRHSRKLINSIVASLDAGYAKNKFYNSFTIVISWDYNNVNSVTNALRKPSQLTAIKLLFKIVHASSALMSPVT